MNLRTVIASIMFAAALLATCPANAVTLGDAFALEQQASVAEKSVCPPALPRKEGEMPDMVRFGCLAKLNAVKMGIANITMALASKLMDECLAEVKAGKPIEQCNASNDKYKKYQLPTQYEAVFQKAKTMYDEAAKEYGQKK